MEKVFLAIALGCAVLIAADKDPTFTMNVLGTLILWGGGYLMIKHFSFFRRPLLFVAKIPKRIDSFLKAKKHNIKNKLSVIKLLVRRNNQLRTQLELTKAELKDTSRDLLKMVSSWSPNIQSHPSQTVPANTVQKTSVKNSSLHNFEFIEEWEIALSESEYAKQAPQKIAESSTNL